MSAQNENRRVKRPPHLLLPLSLILIVAGAAAWVVFESGPHEQPFQWLSPAEANRQWHPGLFESMRNRILRWPPAWRLLTRNRQVVRIDSQVITFPGVVYAPELKARSRETNQNGDVAYLLDRADLADAEVAFASPAASPRTALNSKTAEGERNRFMLGSAMRLTTGVGMRSSMSSGNPGPWGAFCGATLDVLPKIRHRQFSLFVRAESTQAVTNVAACVFTNFSVSCRVTVTNGGAFLVRHVDKMALSYWLIRVNAVDSKGNPIELGK